ncbi:hypothetical protein Bhyg_05164 [Pseudolycoriella hygida]|uniref:Uncharacterized protein n=1 Tax=Pseudolycoriella hygida TaxID=35572 RepID=A0A9Q0NGR5_9DIPT|nr:hypothetical protein Bhyg_05164 [Pseudolycoriella hygida]
MPFKTCARVRMTPVRKWKLDPKSSRSTIYENEELRLRTININAEVERGQSDIKKLRKENDQLRREIWALRDEYDRLDKLLQASRNGRNILNQLNNSQLDSDVDGPRCDSCNQSVSEGSCSSSCETCDEDDDDSNSFQPTFANVPNTQKMKEKLHVNFDHLSIVSEETFTGSCENPSSPNLADNNINAIKEEMDYRPDACSALIDFQSIVPPLAYFENLRYEDIGPNLDASGEIHYSSESINSKDMKPTKKTCPTIGWDFSDKPKCATDVDKPYERGGPDLFVQNGTPKEPIYAEIRKKPTNHFQIGGNLDDLLQNIEHLSQDIIQIQHENQKITSKYSMTPITTDRATINTTDSTLSTIQQAKPYRSEMNLMLCFDGSNPKIIPMENETNETASSANASKQDSPPPLVPNPMNLLPTTLPYIASSGAATMQTSDAKCLERCTETKDCNYLETIRRKIFSRKSDAKGTDKLIDANDKKEIDIPPEVENILDKTVNAVDAAETLDGKRRSRRVSLLFNGRKNDSKIIPNGENAATDLLNQSKSVKHHHHKVNRRHSDGNLRNRRGSQESGMAFGRCSSRESSVSLKSQKSQKSRKSSKAKATSTNVGKIPWFGCWGNECMY